MTKTSATSTEQQKVSRAIITLTKGGMELGLKLIEEYNDSVLFINKRFDVKGDRIKRIENGIKHLMKEIFYEYKSLIFIMATGIVVRSIAPLLESKAKDPAIIVLDENGQNVISLLSGHLGRANEITLDIANRLQSNPVITTASDVKGSMAVDTLAMKLNLTIEKLEKATKVTAHIVNGEAVGIICRDKLNIKLPSNLSSIEENGKIDGLKGLINITNEKEITNFGIDNVVLRPRNLIIGIGCRRGKPKAEIIKAIKTSLDEINKSELSIKHLATIDVKKDEIGIIETANYYDVPLRIVERDDVKDIEKDFETSDFVKETIGVGAVAEPVAFLTSNRGKVVLGKTRYNGITIAIVEEGVV